MEDYRPVVTTPDPVVVVLLTGLVFFFAGA